MTNISLSLMQDIGNGFVSVAIIPFIILWVIGLFFTNLKG